MVKLIQLVLVCVNNSVITIVMCQHSVTLLILTFLFASSGKYGTHYIFHLSGRLHLSMGLLDQALIDLQQGLESAQASGKREDEAKIRHQVRPITVASISQLHSVRLTTY